MNAAPNCATLRVKRCRHGLMMYLANDLIGRSLELYGEFSEFELTLLGDVIQPGMTVIDIGANIGTHTVFFAKRVGPEGRVIAIEPQARIAELLSGNVALNNLTNVEVHQVAAGALRGSIKTPRIDYEAAGSFNFGGVSLGSFTSGDDVPVIMVDDLALLRCDVIKVDAEGMELDALKGAAQTLQQHKPMIHVENNRPEQSPALISWLYEQGYNLWWRGTPYFNPNNFLGATEDIFGPGVELNMIGFHVSRGVVIPGLPQVDSPESWPIASRGEH
jgi:FkbM family methyltransferase